MEAYAKCSASLQRYVDYRIEMTIWNISVVERNYNLKEIITKYSKTRKGGENSKKVFPENSAYWDMSHVQKGRVLRDSLWKETKQVIIKIVGHLDSLDKSQQHTNLNPFYLRPTAMARCCSVFVFCSAFLLVPLEYMFFQAGPACLFGTTPPII